MSEVRSVTTSEEQDTPTFPYLVAQETTIASICFQTNKYFIDKDQSEQSIQSSDTELIQSRLKSCVITNNYLHQQGQVKAIEVIAQSQHYYHSKDMDLSEGKNISQKKQLLNENRQDQQKMQQIARQNIKEQAPILPKTDKSQRNSEKKASTKDKNKSKPSLTKKARNYKDKEDQAFWKYIIHDNDPKMKRTIIKPCRFWMGQHVQYCKNSRIIKRVRREICQIVIHSFDRSAILSSNTDIMTENITKGSITIIPNSTVRLNPQQIIIMTINKEYSFDLSENKLMILAKKGQNRICLQKTKGHIIQNTLNTACAINVKIYLNV